MAKTIYDVLEDKLVEHQRGVEQNLTEGGAKDFPSYRELCGVYRGLALARRELQDLLRKYTEHDYD